MSNAPSPASSRDEGKWTSMVVECSRIPRIDRWKMRIRTLFSFVCNEPAVFVTPMARYSAWPLVKHRQSPHKKRFHVLSPCARKPSNSLACSLQNGGVYCRLPYANETWWSRLVVRLLHWHKQSRAHVYKPCLDPVDHLTLLELIVSVVVRVKSLRRCRKADIFVI